MRMKKKLFFVLGLLMAVVVQAQTYWNGTSNKVFSGSGTQTDPYLIGTAEQLAGLAERTNVDKEDFAGQYIKLTADIYLTNFNDLDTANWKEWTAPIARTDRHSQSGAGSVTTLYYFRGHFDGDGHTIYNMYYNGGAGWGDDWDPSDPLFDPAAFLGDLDFNAMNNALFGNVEGGTVENLNMANARLCGINNTSFLVNKTTDNAVIRNCHVQGEFRGATMYPAGLVALNGGLIENCSANINMDITSTPGIGSSIGAGLVFENQQDGIIRNCTATGIINAFGTSYGVAACGFVQDNYGLVEKSQASFTITGGRGRGSVISGFCARNFQSGVIRECSSAGSISTSIGNRSAGFCSINLGLIESSYSTTDMIHIDASNGPAVAMFVSYNGMHDTGSHLEGLNGAGTIVNCYAAGHHIYNAEGTESLAASFLLSNLDFDYSWIYESPLISRDAFCWYNDDELSATTTINDIRPYGEARSSVYLHSQAFVDTLNLCASFLGTSQWELRDGLPQPTGVYTKNTGVFFAGGEGTKDNPYLISNKTQLENFRWLLNHGCYDFCGEYIKQTADITLNAPMSEWEYQMPEEWIPIGGFVHSHPHFKRTGDVETAFRGVYDGDFHEIKNMYIDNNRSYQGFFGAIGGSWYNGTTNMVAIRNLKITDAYVVACGTSGILAGNVGATVGFPQVLFSQCHTSGKISAASGSYDANCSLGAIVGYGSQCLWLNCTTSAQVDGHKTLIGNIWSSSAPLYEDTIVNYLFTGRLTEESGGYCHAYGYNENVFTDGTVANITYDFSSEELNGVRPTAYLQSKEYVNKLNYAVSKWNALHREELQMDYWEWQEGNYPKLTKNPSYTPVVVTFNSNGGSAVVSKTVVPGSRIEMPVRPLKDGQLFVAWYKDAALTQIFDFYKDSVQSDMTLYARWRNDEREDIDITPFNNKFTSTYHIQTAAQLRGFAALQNGLYDWSSGSAVQTAAPRDFTGKTIVLDNDILLCDTTDWQYWGRGAYGLPWKSIGSGYSGEIVTFNGTFDGQGHVIYGLYVELGGMRGTEIGGLFGTTGDDAVIQNVGIEAAVLDAQRHNTPGVKNDHTWYYPGFQNANYLGMLSGGYAKAEIKQCYAIGRIYNVYNGGFPGFVNASDSVVNCYARIDIYQDNYLQRDSLDPAGAFNFYNNSGNKMVNCYNAGKTKTVGMSGTTSYYNKELVAKPETTKGATSTFSMKTMSNYTGWDFDNVWVRNDAVNDGYPVLRIFHPGLQNSPDPITVTGITLQETNVDVVVGDSIQLHASVVPANAANQKIHWDLANAVSKIIATVDENGLVHIKDTTLSYKWTVVVSATTDDGGFVKKCTLNVYTPSVTVYSTIKNKRKIGTTAWQSINTTAATPVLDNGWEYMVAAYLSPAAAQSPISWQSNDETIVKAVPYADDSTLVLNSVTYHAAYAVLQGLGEGTTKVTATATKYNVSGNRNFKVNQVQEPTYYTIRFLNYNGAVLQNSQVLEGDMPSYTGATPIKPADSEYTYSFNGWSPAIVAATANADYTAQFTATAKPQGGSDCDPYVCDFTKKSGSHTAYTDSWTYDNDWTVFGGANNGGQWDYVKMGGKSATLTTANPVYVVNKTAFECEIASVKVTFPAGSFSKSGMSCNNWGVKVYSDLACTNLLYTVNGGTIAKTAQELTINAESGKPWSAGYAIQVYWDLANTSTTNGIVLVSKIEYIPAQSSTPVDPTYYTIRFLNWDGEELQNTLVLEGAMPSYTSATPTKPADDDYTYSFNGWSPAIVAATANADYTAQFTATAKPQGGGDCDPYVCDFTKKTTTHTAYNDKWTYDSDWEVFGGANNGGQWDYVKMGGKSATLTTANPVYVVNKTAFECEIASVKVTFPAGSFSKSGMSCNDWGVKVYSDLACNNLLYTVNGGTIAKTAQELTINAESGKPWSAGYAIQVYWDLANTSTTNGIVLVSKIEYIPTQSTLPTDIQNVSDSANNVARKVLINGQIFILRGEKVYNAQGALVK